MKEKRKAFEIMDSLDDNINKLKELLRNNCSKEDLDRSRKIFKDIEKDASSIRYNRRRKTMTFLRCKNAGTESELSEARRTKVPALWSWM